MDGTARYATARCTSAGSVPPMRKAAAADCASSTCATHPVRRRCSSAIREGVRVERMYRLARWTDGSTHLWLARRKVTGATAGSSGLQFDQVTTATD